MKLSEFPAIVTMLASALGGGGLVKLLDFWNKKKEVDSQITKTSAEAESINIQNEIDLVTAAKNLLDPLNSQIEWLTKVVSDQKKTITQFSKSQKELLRQIDDLKEMLREEREQREHLEIELKSHKRTIIQLRQAMADKFGKYNQVT